MPKILEKKRAKEKGLIDIVESGRLNSVDISLKPYFSFFRYGYKSEDKSYIMPYPFAPYENYTDYVLDYMKGLYFELKRRFGKRYFSFKIDPKAFEEFRELSNSMDIHENFDDNISILNEKKEVVKERQIRLEQIKDSNKHGFIGIAATLENIETTNGKIVIISPTYRPVCNNVGHIGTRFGLNRYKNNHYEFFWEVYNINPLFINYLKEVHKIITGQTHTLPQIPLQISPEGIKGLKIRKDEIEYKISQLEKKFNGNKIQSKFIHATALEHDKGFFVNHIDAALFGYGFDKLRRRLFSWRGKEGKVDQSKGEYKKVFKIDISNLLENEGYVLPLYSSITNPKAFDIHDLVEVFMARYML